jgi:CBS domain-containing protein
MMPKTIRDVLKNKGGTVVSISADATVYKALELMAKENVGALLVMEDKQLTGIISERDYARKVILEGLSSLETSVLKIMITKVLYITPDKSIEEGLALMSDKRCRHLPVLEKKELVGIVSIGDLVNAHVADKDFMIDQLEHYILGSYYDG